MNTTPNDAPDKPKPILIFFETTVACDYRCRHCRASTQADPAPDEMTTEQLKKAIEGITSFGKPYPMVIFTGGNFLLREDMRDIISYTNKLGIPYSLSPSGSSLITPDFLNFSVENNVSSYSISLDGCDGKTHDWIRRNPGSFSLTVSLLKEMKSKNINVQINTTVMKKNLKELPYVAKLLYDLEINIWEVFFLIKTGRGLYEKDLDPQSLEDVNVWLTDLEQYGITVRTVESPMINRIRKQKEQDAELITGDVYRKLKATTIELFGEPPEKVAEKPKRRGKRDFGMIFVAQNGNVYPDGFLPFVCGNVKTDSLTNIYWNQDIFGRIRSKEELKGKCGYCEFKDICGGSRSRAYASYKDPFAEDPGCTYIPAVPESYVTGA